MRLRMGTTLAGLLLGATVLHVGAFLEASLPRECVGKEACDIQREILPSASKPLPYKVGYANITLDNGDTNFATYFLPDYPGIGKLPAIVHYSPYPLAFMFPIVSFWQKFSVPPFKFSAMVIIQLTGTGNSTGTFNGFNPTGTCTLAGNKWIASQPWSNGVISVKGTSAMGIEGYLTHKNPDVGNLYRTRSSSLGWATPNLKKDVYPGGAIHYCMVNDMTFGLRHISYLKVLMSHESPMDPYWEKTTLDVSDYKSINSPTVHSLGWLDVFIDGQMEAVESYAKYSHIKVRPFHRVLVGPFGHCLRGGNVPYNYSAATIVETIPYILEAAQVMLFNKSHSELSFDAALGFYGALLVKFKVPRYVWYVMGSGEPNNDGLGHYLTSGSRPPPVTKRTLFLDVENGTLEDGRPPYNTSVDYIYHPQNPYPTIGGNNFDPALFSILPVKPTPPKCGLWDQNLVGPRTDVLRLNGSVLTEPVVVFGRNKVELYVSSNCTDTDFVALLVDIYPNGSRILIQQSQIRMRWRDMGEKPQPMRPGEIYKVTINLSHIAYIFRAGHRIGLDITSSTWPHTTVNPNTGAPLTEGLDGPIKVAENTILSGGVLDSSLSLSTTELSHVPVWYPTIPNIPHMLREIEEFTQSTSM